MNPKLWCPKCGGLLYFDWMSHQHKCPIVSYSELPTPQEEEKHVSLINETIYDSEPEAMYQYFRYVSIEHAKRCLLCKSLAEVDLCCLVQEKIRQLLFKWCVFRSTQQARRL